MMVFPFVLSNQHDEKHLNNTFYSPREVSMININRNNHHQYH